MAVKFLTTLIFVLAGKFFSSEEDVSGEGRRKESVRRPFSRISSLVDTV